MSTKVSPPPGCTIDISDPQVQEAAIRIQASYRGHRYREMDVFGGAPRFLAYPRPVLVQSGTDAVLKCQIGGDPRPAVIWERNNEKIDPQGRYRVFEDGNVYNLIITSVTIEDSGQYICKAKNSIGETYAAATLKVEGEPRFLIKPLSTRAGRGEDAVFSCKIWGNPKPDVVWEKDGKKLNDIFESTHFSVGSQDGGWFQLKIFKTRAPDGGVYTCKARNEFAPLSVNYREITGTFMSYCEVHLGSTIGVKCE
uniref:Ig-like domain-containing protein n=1 Tax=Periophthalmus magnuspinnatus TaxID=409849 RepID=A0A3B3Z7Z0_9GOBI